MHSKTIWRLSRRPNYKTNIDKRYPYSEIPYVGDYDLIKIPSADDLLELVDYWGEGRIRTEFGSSGFRDSYCVNHEYQLVSNGPDKKSKIPNRVPVISYENCDTSAYVKDNSVKTVTLMGAPINKSCAADIARMVNRDEGKVIIYGFGENSNDVKNLELELGKKGLVYCFAFELEPLHKEPTLFDSYRSYLNAQDISEELYQSIRKGVYVKAVNITKTLDSGDDSLITEVLEKLLKEGSEKTVSYAYKLWVQEAEIVKKYFPISIRLLCQGDNVRILNKKNLVPLKLETNTQWKFKPYFVNNRVVFSIKNVGLDMFLGLDAEVSPDGQRKAFGYKSSEGGDNYKWLLQPVKRDDDLLFVIMHSEYKQALRFGDDGVGSAHGSSDEAVPESFGWFISPVEDK